MHTRCRLGISFCLLIVAAVWLSTVGTVGDQSLERSSTASLTNRSDRPTDLTARKSEYWKDTRPSAGFFLDRGDTLFIQLPHDNDESWSMATSDTYPAPSGYKVYENFWGIDELIGDIHWWGLCVYNPGTGWYAGDPNDLVFDITFYSDPPDDPVLPPDEVVCTYLDVVPPDIDTSDQTYAGFEMYFFNGLELDPPCDLSEGWVAIQSKATGPTQGWFLWASAKTGDGFSYQEHGDPDSTEYDRAVILTGETQEEWPNHKMHFPQLPDLIGWDVNATFPMILADDWQCSRTGPVDDIHFWGSWKDRDGNPATDDIGNILYFIFSIHSNLPVGHPDNPYNYSIPGRQLWGAEEWLPGEPFDPPTLEAWYDPSVPYDVPNDHIPYWRYDFVDIPDPFYQLQDSIYWLNISAVVEEHPNNYQWGWKNSRDHFMDDAVWRFETSDWVEMYEPPRWNWFDVYFNSDGVPEDLGSTNFYGSGWYEYEYWWNMWFYDNPFVLNPKHIYLEFYVDPVGPQPFAEFAINWSTDYWYYEGVPGRPPLPGENEELYIGRQIFPVEPGWNYITYDIEDYNPEWISIDFVATDVLINGWISHECYQTSMDMAFVITGEPAEVYDFGDAPDLPYCTRLASNGARHRNADGVFEWLGDVNDYFPGGCSIVPKVSLERDADDPLDPDGEPNLNPEDTDHFDDGVLFYPPYNYCQVESVDVLVSTSGLGAVRYQDGGLNLLLHLRAWFDWNQDGDWDDLFTCNTPGDAPEHVIWLSQRCLGPDPQPEVALNNQRFTMDPSTWASSCRLYRLKFLAGQGETGHVWSRFRLNYCEPYNDTACGMAAYGEVEDYLVDYQGEVTEGVFIRGDADTNMTVLMSDAVYTLRALYVPGADSLACLDAGDSNDDGTVLMSDAILTLKVLYVPGWADSMPPPYPGCGTDPTLDTIDCVRHPCMDRLYEKDAEPRMKE